MSTTPLAMALPPLLQAIEERLPALPGAVVRGPLLRARLADVLRDGTVLPPLPAALDPLFASLDEEAWRRLALLIGVLEVPVIRAVSAASAQLERDVAEWVRAAFVELARDLRLHTIELLARSAHRREELARAWLLRQGIGVLGESTEQSMSALERLDYRRLLDEAEHARASAEERTLYLRKLQEKADRLLAPRGKW